MLESTFYEYCTFQSDPLQTLLTCLVPPSAPHHPNNAQCAESPGAAALLVTTPANIKYVHLIQL